MEKTKKFLKLTDCLKSFVKRTSPELSQYNFVIEPKENHAAIESALLNFEERLTATRFKFGVLYARAGQGAVESEMYNNTEDMTTPEFATFLRILGDTVDLEGWTKFRGGLDSKSVGSKSVYTDWEGFEIMFHVSTMLPYMKGAEQQVERKRHIGNDIVVIVFQEGNTPFDPACIKSNFNNVFILVHPEKHPKLSFKVSAVISQDIKLFPPIIPRGRLFEPGPYFRDWMLSKLVHAELTALRDGVRFTFQHWSTRKEMLSNIMATHWPHT
eukprot:TRINITY_DN410_c0_g1_i1.p1 TRINITY_DN410_c0_g1~~TRINITY_DN410_c0_g1_i1.p1  ORF type:complete len:270 (+),score=56.73 TRINITY_DN410_c0_g1_i1:72-881(+)